MEESCFSISRRRATSMRRGSSFMLQRLSWGLSTFMRRASSIGTLPSPSPTPLLFTLECDCSLFLIHIHVSPHNNDRDLKPENLVHLHASPHSLPSPSPHITDNTSSL